MRAETGWSLSMFTSDKHVPALDEKVLVSCVVTPTIVFHMIPVACAYVI